MADRIIAALEYLDAHTSLVLQKPKHRSLGDIEAKYDVIDPTDDLNLHENVTLTGISKTNPSSSKSIDQILKEDRERILYSSNKRLKSALSYKTFKDMPAPSYCEYSVNPQRRRIHRSEVTSASSTRTSVKRLSFTPPGVTLRSSDARDDVMNEIVKKPLTHRQPQVHKVRLGYRDTRSAPCRPPHRSTISTKHSIKRSKTGNSQRNQRTLYDKEWQNTPGPYSSVKEQDMWVVSNSTPAQYFSSGVITGEEKKMPRWGTTVDSMPLAEKRTVPRYERQLGAPPQFGNSVQWYTFAGGDSAKKKPVLTAFTDDQQDEYYNIESQVSQKVAQQLQGSPGIRIAVNGNLISNSMKVGKSVSNNMCNDDGSNDDISDGDSGTESIADSFHSESEEATTSKSQSTDHGLSHCNEANHNFSLLHYIGVEKGSNQYAETSVSETSCSDTTLSDFNKQPQIQVDKEDEAVWKLLEGASPSLWLSKEKWKQSQINAIRKSKKVKNISKIVEEISEPLSWEKQLKKQDAKVLVGSFGNNCPRSKIKSASLPVRFHKLISYDHLPMNFVHMTSTGYRPHSSVSVVDQNLNITTSSLRSAAAEEYAIQGKESRNNVYMVSRPFTAHSFLKPKQDQLQINVKTSFGNSTKGFFPRSVHYKTDDISGEELNAMRQEADYNMKVTSVGNESSQDKDSLNQQNKSKQKSNGISEASTSQNRNRRNYPVTLNSIAVKSGAIISNVDIQPSSNLSAVPVSSLNLNGLETYNVANGPNPPMPERVESDSTSRYGAVPGTKTTVPVNTPKSPLSFFKHSFELFRQDSKHNITHDKVASSKMVSPNHSLVASPRYTVQSTHGLGSTPRRAGGFTSSAITALKSSQSCGSFKSAKKISRSSHGRDPIYLEEHRQNKVEPFDAEIKFQKLVKKPGFIQISHSLNIPSHEPSSTNTSMPYDKLNDSCKVEMGKKSEAKKKQNTMDKPSGIICKSLGGFSGKHIVERKTFAAEGKGNSANVAGGHNTGFTKLADLNANNIQNKRQPNQLTLHGDPVRLNLDKNIHLIYRDLGLTKRNSSPNSPIQSNSFTLDQTNNGKNQSADHRDVISRSNTSSAKSRLSRHSAYGLESVVVNIPTGDNTETTADKIGENVVKDTQHEVPKNAQEELVGKNEVEEVQEDVHDNNEPDSKTKQASNMKSNEVVDSETQYNPPPLLEQPAVPDFDGLSEDPNTKENEKKILNNGNLSESKTEFTGYDDVAAGGNPILSNEKQTAAKNDNLIVLEQSEGVPLTRQRSRSESNVERNIKEDESEVAEEEVDVRGVTKVTVNIASVI
uniref:uncharacterized protein LOC100175283 isoform X2 n=1 Tax=Ciona intestinalis TaxID=7719 RepID=UPI000EF53576|nr:uncharacterized protein LOC100175283 isoform X2 [Ciona intestinalis]|eukprot:XP_026691164.1 uncharacterized protein LOC100175283 isoform X2 [Ciona intestinalis]